VPIADVSAPIAEQTAPDKWAGELLSTIAGVARRTAVIRAREPGFRRLSIAGARASVPFDNCLPDLASVQFTTGQIGHNLR
jgi:hypothetical protein